MWSIVYDEITGYHILKCHGIDNTSIKVPQLREADAMHLLVTLEQAKAKLVTETPKQSLGCPRCLAKPGECHLEYCKV